MREWVKMRDFRLQAVINLIKLSGKSGYWQEWLWPYAIEWIKSKDGLRHHSDIYNLKNINQFRSDILDLGKFNGQWFQRIFEPETKGVRVWEYGKLLREIKKSEIKNKKILDVGAGGSLMSDYLASMGAKVTSLDLANQMEKRETAQDNKVQKVQGDMTAMPFGDKTFDIVFSISAIEHLDNKKVFWAATVKTLNEMKRVVKPGGKIIITTDFYLPKQKNDNWEGSKNKINSAYKWDKLAVMAEIIGAKINSEKEKNELLEDKNRSNFRGRYFTTVFLVGGVSKKTFTGN